MTTKEIIAVLEKATLANYSDSAREGNIVEIKSPAEVIMTGDLHGNELNFQRFVRFADLGSNPQRHLVVHELLHNTNSEIPNECHSYRLVAQAAEIKSKFPNQFHILLGNHATAQATRDEVLKAGQPMVRSFNAGIHAQFGQNAHLVLEALEKLIISMPLAARTENRVWMSHSLPSARHLKDFDSKIFQKKITLDDMRNNTSLHALTWDRSHSKDCLVSLQELWGVDTFIVGHQPQADGCAHPKESLIILASDHAQGCFLYFDTKKYYDSDELWGKIKHVAEIA
ncbi:MAG: hypothetical protein JW936_07825 [Sedimentisphaerales bacterium]|nr:hypothetical protein [Sedimentisphaerales bacterium]